MGKTLQGATRFPLERITRIHQQLKARRFPNCRKIAEEFEISEKTIQRDIDFMRYRLNLPIAYDQQRFGFYYDADTAAEPFPWLASLR